MNSGKGIRRYLQEKYNAWSEMRHHRKLRKKYRHLQDGTPENKEYLENAEKTFNTWRNWNERKD